MEVVLLGTGTLVPEANRASSGVLVEGPGATVPIDLGRGVLSRMVAAGVDPLDLDRFLLTHLHADHSGELVALLFALRHGRAEPRPVELHGPRGLDDLVRRIVEAWPSTTPDYPLTVLETEGGVLIDEAVRVRAESVHHGSHAALGFRIEDTRTGRCMAFTGDSGPGPGLSRLSGGVDLLVAECADGLGPGRGRHLDVDALVDLADTGGVSRVAVVHIDPRHDRAAVLGELDRRLGGRLIEGRDGLRLQV
jgi:ribonuclease BN (tRNA processing enzyme)